MKKTVDNNETEGAIQQAIVRFYRNNYCLVHHSPRCLIISVPNEGNARLSQTGALAGTSDLLVIHNVGNSRLSRSLWIECKTPAGRISPAQRKFEAHVRQLGCPHEYHVVRSLDDFIKIINNG